MKEKHVFAKFNGVILVCTDCPREIIQGEISSHILCTYGKEPDRNIKLKIRAHAFTHELAHNHETTLLRFTH